MAAHLEKHCRPGTVVISLHPPHGRSRRDQSVITLPGKERLNFPRMYARVIGRGPAASAAYAKLFHLYSLIDGIKEPDFNELLGNR